MSENKAPQFLSPFALHKANSRINHAVIGLGLMGQHHIDYILNNPKDRLVAVCDVNRKKVASSLERVGKGCRGYHDFRDMLNSEDIDVVHVVTPPHWHALQCIYALDAGVDVWSEKPMTRTIEEGIWVGDAVHRNSRVFRVNTWLRVYGNFFGMNVPVAPIKKLVASGALGWPLTVRVSLHTGFPWKASLWRGQPDLPPEPVPEELDYDMWLGPAPLKPYTTHRTSPAFRGYWDYDGGGLADMGQHYLDAIQYILGKDDTSPVEIEANAPWPQHPDAVGLWGQVYMKYADGCKLILESCEWGEEETKGKPFIEGPNGCVYPGFRTEPASLASLVQMLPDPEPQIDDFDVSVETRNSFPINEMTGNRSNILVHLANIAIRTGRKLTFNPVRMCFVNDPGANALASQPMRLPWTLF